MAIVASSSSEMQSHSTLPPSVRNNNARWPMAKAGTVPMPINPASCCRNALQWPRASACWLVQPWPDGGTNWRSSVQIGQRSGAASEGANWVPQAVQMKAGIGIVDRENAALQSAATYALAAAIGASAGMRQTADCIGRVGRLCPIQTKV